MSKSQSVLCFQTDSHYLNDFFYLSSAQINERAYQRAAEELAVVKREAVELKVTYKKGHSYNKILTVYTM